MNRRAARFDRIPPPPARLLLTWLALALSVLAGCAGDDGGDPPPTAVVSPTLSAATATPPVSATPAQSPPLATATTTASAFATATSSPPLVTSTTTAAALATATSSPPRATATASPPGATSSATPLMSTTATPIDVATPTPTGDACDVAAPCAPGELCELPSGVCATALDAGSCVEAPAFCFGAPEPVCGCDGLTYGSDCLRRAARVQKAGDEVCPAVECADACDCYATRRFATFCPLECASCDSYWLCEAGRCLERCGPVPTPGCEEICVENASCTPAELCRRPRGRCADRGACGARPDACPAIEDPVCGCDGATYSSECEAARAGVTVERAGPCGEASRAAAP